VCSDRLKELTTTSDFDENAGGRPILVRERSGNVRETLVSFRSTLCFGYTPTETLRKLIATVGRL
jgi:hypothetical protein